MNLIPQATQDAPQTADKAKAISILCTHADRPTPAACSLLLPQGAAKVEPFIQFIAPGSPLFVGKIYGNKFISFLWFNMDAGHRVKWYDLTGREQWEWYEVHTEQERENAPCG